MRQENESPLPRSPWIRAILLFLASNAALLFTCFFGLYLWPERLPVNSQNIFWLASGVNIAGLLLFGLRYSPILIINAFPAAYFLGDPLPFCLLAASANDLEALFGAWFIRKAGAFTGRFETLRSVGSLVFASILAPLCNTLLIPAYLCITEQYPWSDYGRALANWNLSNGTAILIVTPLLISLLSRRPTNASPHDDLPRHRPSERLLPPLSTAILSYLAFDALLAGKGMNFAFLAFPPILYTAVRFGIRETTLALGIVLIAIDAALLTHARSHPLEAIPALLWFIQAITWVLAATGLLLAALGSERRKAERRSLEASLAIEQARLSALRYQINPHFLFNALNSIRATLPLPEEAAREMITSLAGYLRSTLDRGDSIQSTLREELRNLRDYLVIEKHRFGEDLILHFEVDPEAEPLIIPSFLLQPLVENAIRHGLEKNSGLCEITLSARIIGKALRLSVMNTGPWRSSPATNHTGIGLRNLRHRLHLHYGTAATLHVEKQLCAVRVQIQIPLP